MGVSGFRPAPQVEPDESERPGTNIPGPGRTRWESTLPFNIGPLRPSKGTHDDERETTPADDDLQSVDADDFRMWWEQGLAPTAAKGRWKLTLKGRALVGVVAIVGSVLALKGCAPSFDLFVDNGPALTEFPGDKSIAESSDADAPSGKNGAQSAQGKIAKEQLDDLSTQASPAPLPGGGSGDVRRISANGRSLKRDACCAKRQRVGGSFAVLPVVVGAISRSKTRPAGIIQAWGDDRRAPLEPKARYADEASWQNYRPGRDRQGRDDRPQCGPDTRNQPLPIETPAKPEKPASSPNAAQPKTEEAVAVPATPTEASKQPLNPLQQAIGNVFGARGTPAQQPIAPTPTGSTDWAVHLAASKSEDEAKNDLKRLDARYASALNGSTIRLHKARVDGGTVYRLRVAGLSKVDAAALCERVRGDGGSCFVIR